MRCIWPPPSIWRSISSPESLALYQCVLDVDALDEAAHAGVMRSQIALGNRAAAIGQYQRLRHLLDEELGLDPGATSEAEQLYRAIIDAG